MPSKRDIILFLGAGSSVPFGKKTTEQLRTTLQPPSDKIRYNFRNALLSCPEYIDFEYVYSAAIDIRNFLNSYAGHFFRYLSETQNSLYIYREPHDRSSHVKFHDTINDWNDVIRSLEKDVYEYYRWNDDDNTNLKNVYDPLVNLLKDVSNNITICTTNYDKAIETYCEITNRTCVDGFENNHWKDKFHYPKKNDDKEYVYLYKLHGSLDWKKRKNGQITKTEVESIVDDPNYTDNVIIYPTLTIKDHKNEPFNSIFHEFETVINKAEICIVIGFSFRDKHINELFLKFLKEKKLLIVISPTGKTDVSKNLLESEDKEINYDIKFFEKGLVADKSVQSENLEMVTDMMEAVEKIKEIIT